MYGKKNSMSDPNHMLYTNLINGANMAITFT